MVYLWQSWQFPSQKYALLLSCFSTENYFQSVQLILPYGILWCVLILTPTLVWYLWGGNHRKKTTLPHWQMFRAWRAGLLVMHIKRCWQGCFWRCRFDDAALAVERQGGCEVIRDFPLHLIHTLSVWWRSLCNETGCLYSPAIPGDPPAPHTHPLQHTPTLNLPPAEPVAWTPDLFHSPTVAIFAFPVHLKGGGDWGTCPLLSSGSTAGLILILVTPCPGLPTRTAVWG